MESSIAVGCARLATMTEVDYSRKEQEGTGYISWENADLRKGAPGLFERILCYAVSQSFVVVRDDSWVSAHVSGPIFLLSGYPRSIYKTEEVYVSTFSKIYRAS